MTPIKLIRKLGKLIRGGATPKEMFLGCLIGVFIGMVPGLNLMLLLGIVLLVLLNVNRGLAILGFIVGKLACVALAGVTFQTGYALINGTPVGDFVKFASSTPVLALLDLQRYSLLGGIPLALVIGSIFGFIITRIITSARAGLIAASKNQKVSKVGQSKFARFLIRIAFGKQKKSFAEMAEEKHPLFRKSGLALAGIVLVGGTVLELAFIDTIFKSGLRAGLESAVGAEVNIGDARLSLVGGEMAVSNLQITDPDKPAQNMLFIENLRGDLSVSELLTKRFVVDKLDVSVAKTDVPRETPGKVYEQPQKEEQPQQTEEKPEDALDKYVKISKDFEKYKGYFQKIKEYLKKRREQQQAEDQQQEQTREDMQKKVADKGYLEYLNLSAQELLTKRPAWTIRELSVDKIESGEKEYQVQAKQVSSAPELNEQPMSFKVTGSDGMKGSASLDFTKPDADHKLAINAPSVPIGNSISLSDNAPVSVADGKADVDLDGWFSSKELHIPVSIDVKDLQAQAREGKKVLGMDPETAKAAFENLKELKISALIQGTLDSPRLKIDTQQLMDSLKQSLIKAGKTELANRATKEIKNLIDENLKDKIPGDVEKVLPGVKDKLPKDLQKNLPDSLKGVFGGKDDSSAGKTEGDQKTEQNTETKEQDTNADQPEKKLEDKAKDKAQEEAGKLLKKLF